MRFKELNSHQHVLVRVTTITTLVGYYDFLKDVVVLDIDDLSTNKYCGYNIDNTVWVDTDNHETGLYLLRKVTNYEGTFLYARLYKVIFV